MIFPEAETAVNAKYAVRLDLRLIATPLSWSSPISARSMLAFGAVEVRLEQIPQYQLTYSIMRNRVLRAGIAVQFDCALRPNVRHSGMRPLGAGPESILPVVVMDSGFAQGRAQRRAIARRGMTDVIIDERINSGALKCGE
jgi:hypothetical protein